jgi:transcriptional regulator with PAS, ATPase and Fis domain
VININNKLKGKIGLIAPNSDIAGLARKAAGEFGNIFDIYEGNLVNGVEAARQAMERGNEVFISRGGTAHLIEKLLRVPLVSIVFSGVDLLKTVEKAKDYDSRFALMGHDNLLGGIEGDYRFFGCMLRVEKFNDYQEIEESIQRLYKNRGVRVFIGGEAVVECARQLGFTGVLLECGIESIRRAVLEAARLAEMKMVESERYLQFKAITEHSSEGIITVDDNETVKYLNPVARKMFSRNLRSKGEIEGKSLKDILPEMGEIASAGKQVLQVYKDIGDIKVMANYIPLSLGQASLGGLLSFQDVTRIEELEKRIRQEQHAKGLFAKYRFEDIITDNKMMLKTITYARRVARTESSVLITGESGTGKELMAQSIHNASPRKNGPFVAINCAALPESILESELFGYVEGAFTGARKSGKPGLFELAHKGTIFLDEIGDIPLSVQSRLLRVIQEKEVVRIGNDRVIPIDIRIISATNKDLGRLVEEGKFREDLYYRLDIIRIKLPPLRERSEDIVSLSKRFVEYYCAKNDLKPKRITRKALNMLKCYSWPGNIRELQNFIESLVIIAYDDEVIDESVVEQLIKDKIDYRCLLEMKYRPNGSTARKENGDGVLRKIEYQSIQEVLRQVRGNKNKAAEILGISTTTLWRRLKTMSGESQK